MTPKKPSKEIQERIVQAVLKGVFPDLAAQCEGIDNKTLLEWMQRGESESSGPFHDFYHAVIKADDEVVSRLIHVIQESAKTDFRAAAYLRKLKIDPRYAQYFHEP